LHNNGFAVAICKRDIHLNFLMYKVKKGAEAPFLITLPIKHQHPS
jgi:hypothetical protein